MCRTRRNAPSGTISRPGNLTALRELALRRTAQRVDAQMLELHAGSRHPRPLGGGRARAGLRRRRAPARPRWCATPDGWRTVCARPGRRSMSRRRATRGLHRRGARPGRRGAAAGRAPRRRRRHDARAGRGRHRARLRARSTISPMSSSREPGAPRWRGFLRGAVARRLIRRAGDLAIHVLPRTPTRRRRRRPPPAPPRLPPGRFERWIMPARMRGSAAIVLAGLVVGDGAAPAAGERPTSRSCS